MSKKVIILGAFFLWYWLYKTSSTRSYFAGLNFLEEDLNNTSKLDISIKDDASIAAMNLISAEEHILFSNEFDNNLELLAKIRNIRKNLLESLVTPKTGVQAYCLSKHLLAASMRLIEVATKHVSSGNNLEAEAKIKQAKELYKLYQKLNCGCENTGVSCCYGG